MKIRLKSITYAMKAKDLLQSHGIDSAVVRDLRLAGSGCVYAISLSDQYKDVAYEILRKNKIAIHRTEQQDDLS